MSLKSHLNMSGGNYPMEGQTMGKSDRPCKRDYEAEIVEQRTRLSASQGLMDAYGVYIRAHSLGYSDELAKIIGALKLEIDHQRLCIDYLCKAQEEESK